jgi:hypothetical protein
VRYGRPEARRREALSAAGVVQHPDDSGRPFIAGCRKPELLDELLVARRPGDRGGTRVRDVGEQRAERDDELDAEVAGDGNDLVREGAPAEIRLEPEHEHGVPLRLGDGRVVEGRLRPDDLASDPTLERDVGASRLEVEELLGIDVGEAPRLPRLR